MIEYSARVAEIPAQPDVAAVDVQLLLVAAVGEDGAVGIEAIDQVVAAGLDDVGAEQARGAVQVAHVRVEQRAEVVAWLVLHLHTRGAIVVALVDVVFAGERVADVVVAMLVEPRDAGRPTLAEAGC